ncbi:hypothetical protein Tco_1440680 [Tanacetum coccineum]
MVELKETNEILMTSTQWSPIRHRPDASPPGTNIAFSEEDLVLEHCNGEDPVIIKADIGGTVIHRGKRGSKTVTIDFLIVRAPLPYNGILGRPGMRQLVSRKRKLEPEEATKLASPENKSEKEEVEINPLYPYQKVIIGTSLPLKLKEELQKLLRGNHDIFAWSYLEMDWNYQGEIAEYQAKHTPFLQQNEAEYEALNNWIRSLPSRWSVRHLASSLAQENRGCRCTEQTASYSFAHLTKKVLVKVIQCRSTKATSINVINESEVTWMSAIVEYLKDRKLPDDPIAARRIQIKAPQYSLKSGILYRKGYLAPWLRCIGPNQAHIFLGSNFWSCGAYAEARTLTKRQLKPRILLATMYQDATHIIIIAVTTVPPLSLVYGSEVVLPPELGIPTYRISSYDENKDNEELRLNLEFLEETRELAALREAKYKHQTE